MRSIQFAAFFVSLCVCTPPTFTQIRQIDSTKLPQDPAVQQAYTDLLPIDQYARTFEAAWRFPIPQAKVTAQFTSALHALEKAQKQAPSNSELKLFTGLVAHLTYNLDVQEAYQPALELLQSLQDGAGADYRPSWFLGMHQCQSSNTVDGMQNLLHVEASFPDLPRAFWQDYANCAGVTFMPAHAIRAYDNATKIPTGPPTDEVLEKLARSRLKPSDPAATYPKTSAWFAGPKTAGTIRFTSTLCGESFQIPASLPIGVSDPKDGACVVNIQSDPFPSHGGSSTATYMLLTQRAKSAQSLDDFAHGFLSLAPYNTGKPIDGLPCPVARCLAFEIVTSAIYAPDGGGHLIAVFFASEEPDYPGLRLETPQGLPKPDKGTNQPVYYRPGQFLVRYSGALYTFAALDANADIYSKVRPGFDALLKSLIIDTK
jgi:hypothetical protein